MTNAKRGRPLVIAHRGASAARPENTVEAFRHAAELGAEWVELDVRLSADGVLVVHHDARLPDGRAIDELAAAGFPASLATLDQALDACDGMGVNVEIKHDRGDRDRHVARAAVGRLAERAPLASPERVEGTGPAFGALLVSSFDRASIDLVHELEPRLFTAALGFDVGPVAAWLAGTAAAGHAAVNPWDPLVDADLVARAHAEGLEVNVWTVDDPARMAELVGLGVDGIITNVPDVARAVVDGT